MTAFNTRWGPTANGPRGDLSAATFAVTTALRGVAYGHTAPKTGTIVSVEVYVLTKGGAARSMQVSVVTVDASSKPTAVNFGGSAPGSTSITGTGLFTVTLATPATIASRGQKFAVRLDPTGTAPDGVNNHTFNNIMANQSGTPSYINPLGWQTTDGGTTWTATLMDMGLVGIKMGDGGWLAPNPGNLLAVAAGGNPAFNSASAPNEYGAVFQVPYGMTIRGFTFVSDAVAATQAIGKLYAANGTTLLASGTVNPGLTGQGYEMMVIFDTPYALSANANYYLGVTNASAANNLKVPHSFSFSDAKMRGAFPMSDGERWAFTSRTGAGAWAAADTLRMPLMSVLVDSVP